LRVATATTLGRAGEAVALAGELAPGDAAGDGSVDGWTLGSVDGSSAGAGLRGTARTVDFGFACADGSEAGAKVAGANVAASDEVAVATGAKSGDDVWRPATESPAPMTKPTTMTPSTIGMKGSDGPSSRGGGRRRLGGVSCITRALREMNERCFPRNDGA